MSTGSIMRCFSINRVIIPLAFFVNMLITLYLPFLYSLKTGVIMFALSIFVLMLLKYSSDARLMRVVSLRLLKSLFILVVTLIPQGIINN